MASATQFGLIHVDFDTLERIPKLSANGSGRPHVRLRWSEGSQASRDGWRNVMTAVIPELPADARARETSSSR